MATPKEKPPHVRLRDWMKAHDDMPAVEFAKLLDSRSAAEKAADPGKTAPSTAAISLWRAGKSIPGADNRDAIAILTGIPASAWRPRRVREHLEALARRRHAAPRRRSRRRPASASNSSPACGSSGGSATRDSNCGPRRPGPQRPCRWRDS